MKKTNYWIWLQRAVGINADLTSILEPYDGDPKLFCDAGFDEWADSGRFRPERLERMKAVEPEAAYDVMEQCARLGVDIVTPDDEDYPEALKDLSRRPSVLYTRGRTELLRSPTAVAVVGTRKPSAHSPRAAAELCGILAQCGVLVVSGGARGIDTAAHAGALNAHGPTAAVLGSGIGAKYLPENRVLREIIAHDGVLISELEPLTEPGPGTFPIRNRIIAGMAAAVIVMEAGIKSGSLITAKHAELENREVLALDLGVTGAGNRGVTELIADGVPAIRRASEVLDVIEDAWPGGIHRERVSEELLTEDVLTADPVHFPPLPAPALSKRAMDEAGKRSNHRTARVKKQIPDTLSQTAQSVFACFQRDPLTLVELEDALGLPLSTLLGALSELEMSGSLERLDSGQYFFKQDG